LLRPLALLLLMFAACGSPAAAPAASASGGACQPLSVTRAQLRLDPANSPTPGFALRPGTRPVGVALDRDGSSAWVLGTGLDRVLHVMPDGTATEYALPTSELGLQLSQASDGTVWVPEQYRDAVAAIAPDGSARECKVPAGSTEPTATAIASDGSSVWVAAGAAIDRYSGGHFTLYPIGLAGVSAAEVIADATGGAWFSMHGAPDLGRITPAGQVQRVAIGGSGTNLGLLAAPNGDVWVADFGGDRLIRVAADATVTALPVAGGAKPQSLALGPGDVVWMTESGADRLGRVRGGVVEDAIRTGQWPDHLAVSADGWAWFTEYYGDRLGRVRLPA
jgi:streptogramin lyase